MTTRYQTVAAGESWSALGRFRTGRTVTVAFYNALTGTLIPSTNTTTEIGTTGIYRATSSQLSANPTEFTVIVWQMTDTGSGRTDEDVIVVGGFPNRVGGQCKAVTVAASSTTTSVRTNATEASNFWTNMVLMVETGVATGIYVTRRITAYSVTNGAFTVAALPFTPASGARAFVLSGVAFPTIPTPPTAAAIADQVWDEVLSGHLTAGTTGAKLNALETGILSAISGLNDLSSADVQSAANAALLALGYTAGRASNLDNLDATVSSRATVSAILAASLASGDTLDAALSRLDNIDQDVATDIPAILATLATQASVDALPSAADNADAVWDEPEAGHATASTFGARLQGLDTSNLDASISSVLSAIAGLNDLSQAEAQSAANAALLALGYTALRAANLDNLDAAVSSRATVAAILAAVLTSGESVDVALSRLDNIDADVAALPTAAEIDTQLSGTHGAGSWEGAAAAPTVGQIADAVWDELTAGHAVSGSFGELVAALDTSNLDATISSVLSAIAALNDLSQAEAQAAANAALLALGYTAPRAANLDNLDAAVSTRSTLTAAAAADAVWDELLAGHVTADTFGAKINALEVGILTAIGALNDISTGDVETSVAAALTAQGYTTARAALLDNLDAAISAVLTAIAGLNDVSIAEVETAVDTALDAQGYTAARALLLDNLVTILASVEKVRKVTTNRVVVNATDTSVTVYEDDDTTPAFSFTVSADRRTRTPD